MKVNSKVGSVVIVVCSEIVLHALLIAVLGTERTGVKRHSAYLEQDKHRQPKAEDPSQRRKLLLQPETSRGLGYSPILSRLGGANLA